MHQQPIKTCFLQIAAESNELFSYHVLLKFSAKSNKAPHTPAHLLKGRSLQGVQAHHISYSSFAARSPCTLHFLLSIIFTTSADPNEPNTVNFTPLCNSKQNAIHEMLYMHIHMLHISVSCYQLPIKNETCHPQPKKKVSLQTLYFQNTTEQM